METSLNGKQHFINDKDLSISKTLGLQDAWNSKQATITNSSLSIARTIGLQDAFNSAVKLYSTNTFTSNQNFNDITCNELMSSTLNASGVFNMADMIKTDNTVIKGSQFDTIVIRRPTGVSEFSSNYIITLREIQVWVNNI